MKGLESNGGRMAELRNELFESKFIAEGGKSGANVMVKTAGNLWEKEAPTS